MLLNGMLFNCEAEKHLETLEEIDLTIFRKVMKANVTSTGTTGGGI